MGTGKGNKTQGHTNTEHTGKDTEGQRHKWNLIDKN